MKGSSVFKISNVQELQKEMRIFKVFFQCEIICLQEIPCWKHWWLQPLPCTLHGHEAHTQPRKSCLSKDVVSSSTLSWLQHFWLRNGRCLVLAWVTLLSNVEIPENFLTSRKEEILNPWKSGICKGISGSMLKYQRIPSIYYPRKQGHKFSFTLKNCL